MRTSERDMVLRAIDELDTRFANNPAHHERELHSLEDEVKAGTWPGRRQRAARPEPAAVPEPVAPAEPVTEYVYTPAQRKHLVALLNGGPVWRPTSGGAQLTARALLERGLVERVGSDGVVNYALTEAGRAEAERLQAEGG